MTDVCWMAAQLLVDCVTSPEAKAAPLPEPVAEVEAQIPEGSPSPSQGSAAGLSPDLVIPDPAFLDQPACQAPGTEATAKKPSDCAAAPAPVPRPETTIGDLLRARSQTPESRPLVAAPAAPARPAVAADPQPRFSHRPTSGAQPATVLRVAGPRPATGSQLYQQRLAALLAGRLYTRLPPSSFQDRWQRPAPPPSYGQWRALLAREAQVMAASQGHNDLTVVVGDSLSLWLRTELLPSDRFWLNQSISGETTSQMLQRLDYFAATRPTTIQIMAGINDLKNGASDAQVVGNLRQMIGQLRRQHPQARIVVNSILPTRWGSLPSSRIRRVNQQIALIARQQGAEFVDLQDVFSDEQGILNRALTTDGLHLSPQGYQVWQLAMANF